MSSACSRASRVIFGATPARPFPFSGMSVEPELSGACVVSAGTSAGFMPGSAARSAGAPAISSVFPAFAFSWNALILS